MRIVVNKNNADKLKESIFQIAGKKPMQTWKIRIFEGKKCLTHSTEQYIDKCYVELAATDKNTLVVVVHEKDDSIDSRIKNIYYGKFISALLTAFPELNDGVVII